MFKKVHVFRVLPGRELSSEILAYCRDKNVRSGIVIGIIGSLENARFNFLRQLPGVYVPVDYGGPLEIVSGQGSVAVKDGDIIAHIHMQVSNQGLCRGGHLVSAKVFSTAEVTIAELDYQLKRVSDPYTGLNELAQP